MAAKRMGERGVASRHISLSGCFSGGLPEEVLGGGVAVQDAVLRSLPARRGH
jgi:hypothetical protein